jgi:tRNA (cmo5U34)-methyltransferase
MNVGDFIESENSAWNFSGEVPKSFERHISKSVPLYPQGHDLILKLSDFFLSNNSICYDVGCSTGLLAHKLTQRNQLKNIKMYGIDSESDMISFAKEKNVENSNIEFINDDVLNVEFQKSDLIISYYTIQFTRPKIRQLIFDKIYSSLNWGGAFIMFEKVRGADARFQDIMSSLYTDFKLDNGFTPENIISKSKSLKGVLEPFSTQGNVDLMKRAGFIDITTIMKFICFEGFLAIK